MADSEKAKSDFSAGILKLLEPVVEQCDLRAKLVLDSQAQLAKNIELFSAEIAKIQDIQTPQLTQYAEKLNASRKKLKRVDTLVMQTKERVANIARMHQQLLESEKKFLEREAAEAARPDSAPTQEASAATEEAKPASETAAPPSGEAKEEAKAT